MDDEQRDPADVPAPTDERLADPDVEALISEDPALVPDDERVVADDADDYVIPVDERDELDEPPR